MRFAYADPPYPGEAHQYRQHPDYAGEVDHRGLIGRLVDEFPDGWALSTAEKSLQTLLSYAPSGVRVLAWCRPFPPPMGFPRYCWEPVILHGGRKAADLVPKSFIVVDHINQPGRSFIGAKPEGFCFWLFRCLGALPGDDLVDLFPGSGAVGRAWESYVRQVSLPLDAPRPRQLAMGEP